VGGRTATRKTSERKTTREVVFNMTNKTELPRVLLAEDDDEMRTLLASVLRKEVLMTSFGKRSTTLMAVPPA
jgi:hypothetical protein